MHASVESHPPALSARERLWLLSAQTFCALVSAAGLNYVLVRHAWVRTHARGMVDHDGWVVLALGLLALGAARLWQVWEEARLRRLVSVSEAALGGRTWKRALVLMLLLQYAGGGSALAAAALGVPPELIFTALLFLLVAPALTTSWIARRTERLLVRQRDLALQARLAPHFHSNSLSTLKGQIEADPREAQVTADRLAQLFRDLLDHTAHPTVPFGQELAWVEAYLGLERARMGERLQVDVKVAEDVETVPVPPLCLQVLVENALKHGLAPRREGGLLRIQAERTGNGLRLSVTDPGDGTSDQRGTGQALALLRQRLSKPADLQHEAIPGGGFRATVLVRA